MQIPKIMNQKILPRNKKGQGLIMGLVMAIAALILTVIIAFVIVSNVATVEEEIAGTSAYTAYVVNESGNLNDTAYTLVGASVSGFTGVTITQIWNGTTGGAEIDVANATVTSAGVVTNGTGKEGGWLSALFTYNYNYKGTTVTTENLRGNFTTGVSKVAAKIPTILLIAAVVLILGVLVLLWTQYKRMDIGGKGGGGL